MDVSIELAYEEGREQARHLPEIETAMYRIVQEALTNAAKHGNAKRAVVEVHEDETDICVSVRDDGAGFDPSEHTDGFGLLGMHERVQLLEELSRSTPRPAVARRSRRASRSGACRRRAPPPGRPPIRSSPP